MRTARILACLLALLGTSAPSRANFRQVAAREATSFRSMFRTTPRFLRLAAGTAASIGAGLAVKHLTGSPAEAAFSAYVAGTIVDRAIDSIAPRSRPLGWSRPSAGRDAAQTLLGAGVAAAATPFALRLLDPMSHLGDGAPGVIGLGARLLGARPILQAIGGTVVTLLANGARAGLSFFTRPLRRAAR